MSLSDVNCFDNLFLYANIEKNKDLHKNKVDVLKIHVYIMTSMNKSVYLHCEHKFSFP